MRGIFLLFLLFLFGCLLLLADLLLDVQEAEGGESFLVALDPLQAEAFIGGESVAVVIIALFFTDEEEESSDSESDDDLLGIPSSPSLSSTADDLADILRPSSSPATGASPLLHVSSMVGLVRPSDVSLFVIASFLLEISSVASFVAAADLEDLPPTLRDGAGEAPPALLAPAAVPLRRERAMVAGFVMCFF